MDTCAAPLRHVHDHNCNGFEANVGKVCCSVLQHNRVLCCVTVKLTINVHAPCEAKQLQWQC